MSIESLPAKELVNRWIKTNDEFGERRLGEEIKQRTQVRRDGEPLYQIKARHRELWTGTPETSFSRESGMSQFDYKKMKRIQARTEKILGREAVDIIRRLDLGTRDELLARLSRARRISSMEREARSRRRRAVI